MANTRKTGQIKYSEPADYFPKEIREKFFEKKKTGAKRGPKPVVAPNKFIIQNSNDQGVSYKDIVKKVNKAAYKDRIKTLDIYVKSEEGKAYYVINGEVTGSVDIY